MKTRLLTNLPIMILSALALFGCGGGGGGGTAAAPKAVVTVGLQGTPSSQPIGTVDFVLNLPAGVTAQTKPAPAPAGETLDTVVVASGVAVGGTAIGNYTAAVGSTPGNIRIIVAKVGGFTTGNFVTIYLDYTGTATVLGDFSVDNNSLTVSNANNSGLLISGLTAVPALQIQ